MTYTLSTFAAEARQELEHRDAGGWPREFMIYTEELRAVLAAESALRDVVAWAEQHGLLAEPGAELAPVFVRAREALGDKVDT